MSAAHSNFDYDLAIIGGGSGGYAAARTAAANGLKTVVIEGGEEVGGLCILRGCMPTKALLYAAEVMHLASHTEPWGIRTEDTSFNFIKVMARKDALIKEFAEFRHQQLVSGKFRFIRAMARFTDAHTVELTESFERQGTSGGRRDARPALTAKHFLIATGSVVAPSPLPQLNELDCLNSDSALKLTRLPKSLIMLGGGAVAVEFAQFFARFGVGVTLIQRSPHVLHECDSDAASVLEGVFGGEGITVYTGTKLLDAHCVGNQKEIVFEHRANEVQSPRSKVQSPDRPSLRVGHQLQSSRAEVQSQDGPSLRDGRSGTVRVQADEIFFALGRIPNIASLGLEKAGVQLEYNRIATNSRMQTSVPHIYAAGDCAGLHEIVHIAVRQGEVAAHNIANPERPKEMDSRLLIEVIFTEPQIATVGLTEKRADVENIPYVVASYPFIDHGKSLIMEAKDGFVKLLADPIGGEILGGCCVGPQGGELIHEIVAAMSKRMTVQELAEMPHYHPTLAEIWTYPAEELAEKVASRASSANQR